MIEPIRLLWLFADRKVAAYIVGGLALKIRLKQKWKINDIDMYIETRSPISVIENFMQDINKYLNDYYQNQVWNVAKAEVNDYNFNSSIKCARIFITRNDMNKITQKIDILYDARDGYSERLNVCQLLSTFDLNICEIGFGITNFHQASSIEIQDSLFTYLSCIKLLYQTCPKDIVSLIQKYLVNDSEIYRCSFQFYYGNDWDPAAALGFSKANFIKKNIIHTKKETVLKRLTKYQSRGFVINYPNLENNNNPSPLKKRKIIMTSLF